MPSILASSKKSLPTNEGVERIFIKAAMNAENSDGDDLDYGDSDLNTPEAPSAGLAVFES